MKKSKKMLPVGSIDGPGTVSRWAVSEEQMKEWPIRTWIEQAVNNELCLEYHHPKDDVKLSNDHDVKLTFKEGVELYLKYLIADGPQKNFRGFLKAFETFDADNVETIEKCYETKKQHPDPLSMAIRAVAQLQFGYLDTFTPEEYAALQKVDVNKGTLLKVHKGILGKKPDLNEADYEYFKEIAQDVVAKKLQTRDTSVSFQDALAQQDNEGHIQTPY
jgi:hypothetical protein